MWIADRLIPFADTPSLSRSILPSELLSAEWLYTRATAQLASTSTAVSVYLLAYTSAFPRRLLCFAAATAPAVTTAPAAASTTGAFAVLRSALSTICKIIVGQSCVSSAFVFF